MNVIPYLLDERWRVTKHRVEEVPELGLLRGDALKLALPPHPFPLTPWPLNPAEPVRIETITIRRERGTYRGSPEVSYRFADDESLRLFEAWKERRDA